MLGKLTEVRAVRIICDAVLKDELLKHLHDLGATGSTWWRAHGKGEHPTDDGLFNESPQMYLEVWCHVDVAEKIMKYCNSSHFTHIGMAAGVTPLYVSAAQAKAHRPGVIGRRSGKLADKRLLTKRFGMRTRLHQLHLGMMVCGILACLAAADLQAGDRDGNVPRFLTGRQTSPGDAVHPPDHWSATDNIAWKTDIVGLGWSSPIVWKGRVYLTTCINTSKDRKPRKGLYLEDVDATKYPRDKSVHLWKTLCLDLATGKIVWEQTASEGVPAKPHHIKNTLASETPTTDGERLYVLFGNLGLFCYSLDGRPLWTVPIPPRETRYGWGTAMSPVVFGDRLYYADDNEESASLVALDKRTGKEVWRVTRKEKTNYSTPYIWETPNRTELVISGINWVTSYDLSGKELWKIKGKSILAIPTPFAHDGLLYVTSGHVLWGKHRIYAIRPGAPRRSLASRR